MSGAENSEYSLTSLDINCPQLVILQTLLNSKKRIELNVGDSYRREAEKNILANADYFAVTDKEEANYIKDLNPNAKIFNFIYPTSQPPFFKVEKKYDFIFFAGVLSHFKGTTDAVQAMLSMLRKYPNSTMAIVGNTSVEYKEKIRSMIIRGCGDKNIFLLDSFPTRDELFKTVLSAKCAVLPGITAPLNTTVREAMLLGIPTIVYQNDVTSRINSGSICLLEATMTDVLDLAEKMSYALENPDRMLKIGQNGKKYAESNFSITAVDKNLMHIIKECINND